jgi:hypothetical protein
MATLEGKKVCFWTGATWFCTGAAAPPDPDTAVVGGEWIFTDAAPYCEKGSNGANTTMQYANALKLTNAGAGGTGTSTSYLDRNYDGTNQISQNQLESLSSQAFENRAAAHLADAIAAQSALMGKTVTINPINNPTRVNATACPRPAEHGTLTFKQDLLAVRVQMNYGGGGGFYLIPANIVMTTEIGIGDTKAAALSEFSTGHSISGESSDNLLIGINPGVSIAGLYTTTYPTGMVDGVMLYAYFQIKVSIETNSPGDTIVNTIPTLTGLYLNMIGADSYAVFSDLAIDIAKTNNSYSSANQIILTGYCYFQAKTINEIYAIQLSWDGNAVGFEVTQK